MTETIESMATPIDQLWLAQQLGEQARAEGVELIGPGGLLTGLTKSVLEIEMSGHLGYDKHDAMGRNSATHVMARGRRRCSPRSVRSRSTSPGTGTAASCAA